MVADAEKLYPFESFGYTLSVGIHVVRSSKAQLMPMIWSYVCGSDSCRQIQENITHSNHLVIHSQQDSCCLIQYFTHSNYVVLRSQAEFMLSDILLFYCITTYSFTELVFNVSGLNIYFSIFNMASISSIPFSAINNVNINIQSDIICITSYDTQ